MTAGEILHDLRIKAGKSMNDVSGDLDISVSAISLYESGKRIPRENIKKQLAKYYGVTVPDIFYAKEVHET
jgi:transcriptional regulator with XRE-family HTH domain